VKPWSTVRTTSTSTTNIIYFWNINVITQQISRHSVKVAKGSNRTKYPIVDVSKKKEKTKEVKNLDSRVKVSLFFFLFPRILYRSIAIYCFALLLFLHQMLLHLLLFGKSRILFFSVCHTTRCLVTNTQCLDNGRISLLILTIKII
jgi:hypothetical protein